MCIQAFLTRTERKFLLGFSAWIVQFLFARKLKVSLVVDVCHDSKAYQAEQKD